MKNIALNFSRKTLLKFSTIDCDNFLNFPTRSNKPRKLNQPLGYVPCLHRRAIISLENVNHKT